MAESLDKAIKELRKSYSSAQVEELLRQKLTAFSSPDIVQPRSSARVHLPTSTTTTYSLKTSTLKPSVSHPVPPLKDICPSNLYKIEQDYAPLSDGYSVICIGSSYSDVGGHKIYRGDV